MNAKVVTALLVGACVVYLVLIGQRALVLMASGEPVALVMGAALLVLPVVGGWVVWREVEFGRTTARLADLLAQRGELPADDLPRRPSGRPERAAADARFAERRDEVARAPDDWGAWFRLGVAYEDAGDRRRARSAMRHAIALHSSRS